MEETYEQINYSSSKEHKKELWELAFGLQQTDGLTPSDYVRDMAEQNIRGQVSYQVIISKLKCYYDKTSDKERVREADIVSVRIVELLEMGDVLLKPFFHKSIHRFLFTGVLPQLMKAGEYRTYDIRKREHVLDGESVNYTSAFMVVDTLEYDFSEEEKKIYKHLSVQDIVSSVEKFISSIWQVHPFPEGNTRTIAVFTILYLQTKGITVNLRVFATNAAYFRDALVLANTSNPKYRTQKPLDDFFFQLIKNQENKVFESLR